MIEFDFQLPVIQRLRCFEEKLKAQLTEEFENLGGARFAVLKFKARQSVYVRKLKVMMMMMMKVFISSQDKKYISYVTIFE